MPTSNKRHDVGCNCAGCMMRIMSISGRCRICTVAIDDHVLTKEGQAVECPKQVIA